MVDQLEQAVAMSFGPLENLIKTADLDVDSLIETVRTGYSGQGGPAAAPVVSTRSFDDPGAQQPVRQADARPRPDEPDADRGGENPLRDAAYVVLPLHQPASGAAGAGCTPASTWPRRPGTPIYATADGVVVDAGRESGYGNVCASSTSSASRRFMPTRAKSG